MVFEDPERKDPDLVIDDEDDDSDVKTSPLPALSRALKGIDLPADKEGLYDYADENDADDAVLDLIDGLPDEEFHSVNAIMSAAKDLLTHWDESDMSPDDFE